ncbi:hypothetical protein Tco_0145510 [Tanacetum coccineum]
MLSENSLIYKEKTKKLHDSKIKNRIFNVGDQVLLFNSRLKIFSGKLKSRWSGPFTITEVYPYGTAKLSHADGSNFKVNCHRLKHYYGGIHQLIGLSSFQTFPRQLKFRDRVSLLLGMDMSNITRNQSKNETRERQSDQKLKKSKPTAKRSMLSLLQSLAALNHIHQSQLRRFYRVQGH